jgi:hypothetical protein
LVIPIVISVSILEDDELSNLLLYPLYSASQAVTTGTGLQTIQRSLKLADTDVVKMLTFGGVTIVNGAPKSLEGLTDLVDYQVTSGKTAKLILILSGVGTTDNQFKVWESAAADTASGTAKYTYAGTNLENLGLITISPEWDIVQLTFAASKYITIEVTSTSDSVRVVQAVVIES